MGAAFRMGLGVLRIGTAGWAIPRTLRDRFPDSGTALERYAGRFGAAEINSTFHRVHRVETFGRWAAAVPDGFRFAVKVPKTITHERRLAGAAELLRIFLDDIAALGPTLGPLLVQLPPSLAFDAAIAASFFEAMREGTDAPVACEPRHPSWFGPQPDELLRDLRVARVAADPARVPEAGSPGGWPGLAYFRLHGSPRMYYSEYGAAFLAGLAERLAAFQAAETWCIFDNTTSGAAAGDALLLQGMTEAARAR